MCVHMPACRNMCQDMCSEAHEFVIPHAVLPGAPVAGPASRTCVVHQHAQRLLAALQLLLLLLCEAAHRLKVCEVQPGRGHTTAQHTQDTKLIR